jgi:hypothetical protein
MSHCKETSPETTAEPARSKSPSFCKVCAKKGLLKCKHLIHQCQSLGCKKKPFKNGFCFVHIPKPARSPVTPEEKDPRLEEERQERIRRVNETREARFHFIQEEIQRLKDLEDYSNPDHSRLDAFIYKIICEQENEQARLEREFDETMRHHRRQFQAKYGQRRTFFGTWKADFERKKPKSPTTEDNRRNSDSDNNCGSREEKSEAKEKNKDGKKSFKFPSAVRSLFSFLEIDPTQDIALIRMAYKRCAIKNHPDKNTEEDATEKFQSLSSAYEEIMDFMEEGG